MTTNSQEIEAQSPEKNMQVIDDSKMTAQATMIGMSNNSEEAAEAADVEEGELPEEGEITDDEEEESETKTKEAPQPSEPSPKPAVETPVPETPSTTENPTVTTTSPPKEAETSEKSPKSKEEGAKKRGPSSPLADPYAAKQPALSPDAPQLPPRRRQPWTEAVLCKFFREGYCRDGETCAYSHNAAHSNRKPELCKFYQQGFCKKGLACTLLHGEYPCKAFHEGKCDKNPCKYSHVPLNDYTRAIFEQLVQDEALAAKIVIPQQPSRRRVLLPRPGPNSEPHAPARTSPKQASPKQEEPQPLAVIADSAHDFDPSKFNGENSTPVVNEPFVAMTSAQDPDELLVAGETSVPDNQKPYNILSPESSSNPPINTGMSITDMLEQIAEPVPVNPSNYINLEELMNDAAPSNPPKHASPIADTPLSPSPRVARERVHRLIPIAPVAPEYDSSFMQRITSDKFKDDPRVQLIIQRQFDCASDMFGKQAPAKSSSQKTSLLGDKPSNAPRDPRQRPQDPRQRPISHQVPINGPPPSNQLIPINGNPPAFPTNNGPMNPINAPPPTATTLDDAHFKSMVEKQLQMVNEFKIHESEDGNYRDSRYEEGPRGGRFKEEDERYAERRDYDRGSYSNRGYGDRQNYGNYDERAAGRFEEPYRSYEEDPSYRGSSRYPPPPSRGVSTRGSRGFHEGDRYPPRRPPTERFDPRWEERPADSYRREPYYERERRDYGRPTASGRFRERSRSRSPRRNEPGVEERPLTMREKRKNNEYQSPLARA